MSSKMILKYDIKYDLIAMQLNSLIVEFLFFEMKFLPQILLILHCKLIQIDLRKECRFGFYK